MSKKTTILFLLQKHIAIFKNISAMRDTIQGFIKDKKRFLYGIKKK